MIEQATEVALGMKSQDRQSSSRRAERRAADKVDTKTIAAKVKASPVLDAVMPNGENGVGRRLLGCRRDGTILRPHQRTTHEPPTNHIRAHTHHISPTRLTNAPPSLRGR
jgi:hypothetical protein